MPEDLDVQMSPFLRDFLLLSRKPRNQAGVDSAGPSAPHTLQQDGADSKRSSRDTGGPAHARARARVTALSPARATACSLEPGRCTAALLQP